jgi:hypothetical protein
VTWSLVLCAPKHINEFRIDARPLCRFRKEPRHIRVADAEAMHLQVLRALYLELCKGLCLRARGSFFFSNALKVLVRNDDHVRGWGVAMYDNAQFPQELHCIRNAPSFLAL